MLMSLLYHSCLLTYPDNVPIFVHYLFYPHAYQPTTILFNFPFPHQLPNSIAVLIHLVFEILLPDAIKNLIHERC